ncbi:hypothetical protein ABZX90_05875 [Streptomyces sp. NPDC002935]
MRDTTFAEDTSQLRTGTAARAIGALRLASFDNIVSGLPRRPGAPPGR